MIECLILVVGELHHCIYLLGITCPLFVMCFKLKWLLGHIKASLITYTVRPVYPGGEWFEQIFTHERACPLFIHELVLSTQLYVM